MKHYSPGDEIDPDDIEPGMVVRLEREMKVHRVDDGFVYDSLDTRGWPLRDNLDGWRWRFVSAPRMAEPEMLGKCVVATVKDYGDPKVCVKCGNDRVAVLFAMGHVARLSWSDLIDPRPATDEERGTPHREGAAVSDVTDTDRVQYAIEEMEKAAEGLDLLADRYDDFREYGQANTLRAWAVDFRDFSAVLRGDRDADVAEWLDQIEGD